MVRRLFSVRSKTQEKGREFVSVEAKHRSLIRLFSFVHMQNEKEKEAKLNRN
jgi:putative SOS response-associated peptidase YedK